MPPPVSPPGSGSRRLSSSGSWKSTSPCAESVSPSGSTKAVRPQLLNIRNSHGLSEVRQRDGTQGEGAIEFDGGHFALVPTKLLADLF